VFRGAYEAIGAFRIFAQSYAELFDCIRCGQFDYIFPSVQDFEKCDLPFGETSNPSGFAAASVASDDPNSFDVWHSP
jgi:hypothetical protein